MNYYEYMYRKYFSSFVYFAFRELHPDEEYFDNWHINLMADMLDFSWPPKEGAFRRIIFNLPTSSLKTHVCSVSFPAWILGRDPRLSILILSESHELAWQLQEQCAVLMGSPRYRKVFPRAKISKVGKSLELTYGGGIRHAGVSYSSQHKKSDIVIIDNPQSLHSLERFRSENFIELGRLLKKPKEGLIVLATRRLGKGDLTSFLCKKHEEWGRFRFPGISLCKQEFVFPPYLKYKTQLGEPLNERVETWENIERHFQELGAKDFCYQYLQGCYTPRIEGGAVYDTSISGYPVVKFVRADPEGEVSDLIKELKSVYQRKASTTT